MLILIIVAMIATVLIVYLPFTLIYYIDKHNEQQMSFRQFQLLYAIAPSRWSFDDISHYLIYLDDVGDIHRIYAKTMFDSLRLCWFFDKMSQRENGKIIAKETEQLLRSWNHDIEKYRNEHNIEEFK